MKLSLLTTTKRAGELFFFLVQCLQGVGVNLTFKQIYYEEIKTKATYSWKFIFVGSINQSVVIYGVLTVGINRNMSVKM